MFSVQTVIYFTERITSTNTLTERTISSTTKCGVISFIYYIVSCVQTYGFVSSTGKNPRLCWMKHDIKYAKVIVGFMVA